MCLVAASWQGSLSNDWKGEERQKFNGEMHRKNTSEPFSMNYYSSRR
jgi:hypothetical protein